MKKAGRTLAKVGNEKSWENPCQSRE